MSTGSDAEEAANWAALASADAELYAGSDSVHAELMATYAELGDLLAVGPADGRAQFEFDCRCLVGRLIALGRTRDDLDEQRFAAWLARNTVGGVAR